MQPSNKSFLFSLLASTFLLSANANAQLPDVNLNINTPIPYTTDYVGLVIATPINTINLNINNTTFKKSVFGNKVGIGVNSNLSFNGDTVAKDVVGLERSLLELGKITDSNTININGGTINGNVLATKDVANYAGTDHRNSNNINLSAGRIGGNIEGGAGAQQNNIVITGGTLKKISNDDDDDDDEGPKASGTIYAGSNSSATVNKSTNATVTLKDLNNSNSFLTSFIQGAANAGTILGSNITGTSELKFDGVNGNFQGGVKDFNTVTITSQSLAGNATNVKLTGNTYNANVWNVNGILDTNGKTLGIYNGANLNVNIGATGSLTNQLLSSASVIANNLGSINGINAGLNNITLNNTGILTGIYNGNQVQITNALGGTINGNTSLTSTVAGFLNNSGLINANLTLNGGITINNQSGGNVNNSTVTNNQPVLDINNSGTISNTTYVNSDDLKTINLNNKANGEITNNLTIRNGIMNLNNELNGKLYDANMTSDSAVLNIDNDGKMYGNNSINGVNGGTVYLKNDTTGDLTGALNINSGLQSFTNAGTIHDLTINNKINYMKLTNTGTVNGNNVINNTIGNGFIIDNASTGTISGSLNNVSGNLALNNAIGGNLHDLTMMVSDTGNGIRLENSGLIDGSNTINVTNSAGRVIIGNNSGGNITGNLNNINGSEITNHDGAKIHDLIFTNNQVNTGITNYGDISNLSLKNTDNSKYMTIFNFGENNVGEIKDNLSVDNGSLIISNTGSIHDANIVAQNGARIEIYNTSNPPTSNSHGTISGTNTFDGQDTSNIYVTNRPDGMITGIFNTKNGTTVSNQGLIDGLVTNNSQNVLNFTNSSAGELRNTLTFNNSDDTKTVNLNNRSSDILNGALIVKNGILELNNGAESTINGYAMTSDSAILNVNNGGTISGINSITNVNDGSSTLTNYGYATLGGNLTAKNGVLDIDNQYAGQITNLDLKADTGTVNVSNSGAIGGNTVLENANNGIINLTNEVTGTLKDNLVVKSGLDTFANLGTIENLTLTNQQVTLDLDNTGIISGTNAFNNSAAGNTININNNSGGSLGGVLSSENGIFNINNNTNALLHDLSYTNNGSTSAIVNTGVMSGNNTLANTAGTLSLTNNSGGTITGGLTLNGGLNSLENNAGGIIGDLTINSNQNLFTINNSGSIVNSNVLNATNEIKIVNNGAGTVNSNLTINAPITSFEQNSSGVFNANIASNSGSNILNLTNTTSLSSVLSGLIGTVNLVNSNTSLTAPSLILGNTGTVQVGVNVNNNGYTQINNSGNMNAPISDANSPNIADTDCPEKIVELNNSGNISGDISVVKNKFIFNNTATGNVTSEHVDTRDFYLNNSGTFNSDASYLFSVRDHMEVENSGLIYGRDMAFKLIGKPEAGKDVKGFINNSGTIYSQGITIGYDGSDVACPTCYLQPGLTINNTGTIVAVDVATLTNPDLNSYAVNASNAVVNNNNGGLIGGSMHVKDYNQESGATWVTFMDKDLTKMSTITAENKINIADDATLLIHTNNDVKAFTNGQTFDFVTAKNMSDTEIDAQIENFKLKTDSPFADYSMITHVVDGVETGAIQFNHVNPTNFATATDLTTASHNATILGSQRLYELFVNRDINQVQGMSSGDSYTTTDKLNFMPIGGTAHQGSKDGHAGFDTDYYGGIGYFEHDFDSNLKGGLGFAYMNNSTKFKDIDKSKGSIDSYRPFAYINYETGQWRFDLAAGVAKHKVDNKRKYSFNNTRYLTKAKYDADEISGHFNIGYKMVLPDDYIVQPIIGAYAANLKTDSFKETGNGPMNMNVKSDDYNSFKSMLGVKFSKEYALDNGGSFTPELHMRWYHEMGDTQGGVSAYFLAQEQLFNTSGIETPKDIGDIAIRMTTKTGTNFDLFAEAYYQFGDKFYNTGGTLGLQYNF